MSEHDGHEPSMREQLFESALRMAEDADDYCAIVHDAIDDIEYDVTRLHGYKLEELIDVLDDQLAEAMASARGLYEDRHVTCSGFGSYMLTDADGKIVEGKMLGGKDRLYGAVHDVRVKKIPLRPAIMAEGKGNWSYPEILSACVVIKWPNVINFQRNDDDKADISELYAWIPLEYCNIKFEPLLTR